MTPWWHYALVYGAAAVLISLGVIAHAGQNARWEAGETLWRTSLEGWVALGFGAVILALAVTGHVS